MVDFLIIAVSLFLLVKSADVFVEQASSLAKKLRINDFIIGFTIVAFGTSLPELISTIFSSTSGHNDLVVSNIIGSNITNLCLIFGIVALFNTFRIRKRDVHINIPLNLAAMMAFWALTVYMGFSLNWAAGISLILIFIVLLILSKDYNHFDSNKKEYAKFSPLLFIGSLVLLVISGKISVNYVVALALESHIAESILGYFLLAVGTSLPELVTTWIAVRKHDSDMGMGNILGSNLFNLLFILGVSSFIHPIQLAGFKSDLVFLTGAIMTTFVLAIFGKKYYFSRREGAVLLLIYVGFIVFQITRTNNG